jgi:hypothetical protein
MERIDRQRDRPHLFSRQRRADEHQRQCGARVILFTARLLEFGYVGLQQPALTPPGESSFSIQAPGRAAYASSVNFDHQRDVVFLSAPR